MVELRKAGAFTLLAIACLTIMVGCVIVPGLNEIAAALGVASYASWLVTVPALGVVVFGPLAGKLIDRVGAWHALAFGLFAYGLLGAGGIFFHGLPALLTERLLLGGATAVVMAAGTGLIARFYQGEARLRMIARQGMSIELGGVIFLFIGGLLATISWRWPFALYLFAWVMLAMLIRFVPKPTTNLAEEEGGSAASHSLKAVYMVATLSLICFFTAIIIIPQYFHQQGIGAADTGYFLSFISLIAVIAAALLPRILPKAGSFPTLILAFLCYGIAHLLFAVASQLPVFIAGGVLMGFGFGLSVPLVNHLTVEGSSPRQRGRNLATLSMAIFSGQFLSSFMAFIPGNLSWIFLATALLSLCVIVVLVLIRRRQRAFIAANQQG